MTTIKYVSAVIVIIIATGCSLGSGPSESEVREGVVNAISKFNWSCTSIDKTLTLDNFRHTGTDETDRGTYHYVEAEVTYRCHLDSEPVDHEYEYELTEKGSKWQGKLFARQ